MARGIDRRAWLKPDQRGYFGIGVEGVSKSANVGALLRTAHAFGAAFCFTVGAGWDARDGRLADTADTPATCRCGAFPTSTRCSCRRAACWSASSCWTTRPTCRRSAIR